MVVVTSVLMNEYRRCYKHYDTTKTGIGRGSRWKHQTSMKKNAPCFLK